MIRCHHTGLNAVQVAFYITFHSIHPAHVSCEAFHTGVVLLFEENVTRVLLLGSADWPMPHAFHSREAKIRMQFFLQPPNGSSELHNA